MKFIYLLVFFLLALQSVNSFILAGLAGLGTYIGTKMFGSKNSGNSETTTTLNTTEAPMMAIPYTTPIPMVESSLNKQNNPLPLTNKDTNVPNQVSLQKALQNYALNQNAHQLPMNQQTLPQQQIPPQQIPPQQAFQNYGPYQSASQFPINQHTLPQQQIPPQQAFQSYGPYQNAPLPSMNEYTPPQQLNPYKVSSSYQYNTQYPTTRNPHSPQAFPQTQLQQNYLPNRQEFILNPYDDVEYYEALERVSYSYPELYDYNQGTFRPEYSAEFYGQDSNYDLYNKNDYGRYNVRNRY